ncbi:MAG: putative DNA binding domain-containing protein [Myxococcales bacterium]|nr:putative DNA binding domain-containing protein [Myxococcales bacterium]
MTTDEIDKLREGWDFEAKLAAGRDGRGAVPDSVWETYSAMANTSGGLILLGAKERRDGSLDLRGVVDPERVESELWNLIQNPQKVSANILRRHDVERLQIGDASLLLIRVPKAEREDRPVFVNGSWERGTYLRVHEGDRRARPDVARRMLADSVRGRDANLLADYTVDDLNPASVRRYREYFATRRPEHTFLEKDDAGFLEAVGAVRRERREPLTPRPTWAGLWMLGEEASIREVLPHWHLSFKELPDEPDDRRRWLDRVHPDGTWNANLFEFYLRTIVKLHDGLKVPFAVEQGQYRVDETAVHIAVREALVNTLVHADYQGTTGVRVVKRRSGFEFVNPGLLLVTPEQVWKGGVSEARNPALQRLFGLLKVGEREGSGGPAMRMAWREQHWRAPRIWEDTEHGETHLRLPLESLLPDWAIRDLVQRWGAQFTSQDELGRSILVTAEVERSVDHQRVRELSDAHPREITLKLQQLVRQGLLGASGGMRSKAYAPCGRAPLPLFTDLDAVGKRDQASTERSNAHTSARNAHTSAANAHTSAANAHTSAANAHTSDDDAGPSADEDAPVDGGAAILGPALRRVQRRQKAPRAWIEAAILEYCSPDYRTAQAIADAIGRSIWSVKSRYLPDLVASGRIQPRYPHLPNHPAQAYRTHSADEPPPG